MATASTTAQDLAKQVGSGAITIQANTALQATSISSKLAANGIKALSFAMNTLVSMGISIAITAIITGISKLVNMQKDYEEKIKNTTEEIKSLSEEITKLDEEIKSANAELQQQQIELMN